MARDYKKRTPRRRAKSKGTPNWAWFLAGAVLGGVGVGTVLLSAGGGLWDLRPRAFLSPKDSNKMAPAKGPAKRKPHFEFYSLLPEKEVTVPKTTASQAPVKQPTTTQASKQGSETYVLQVGAFHQPEDADRMKASVALLGLDTSVQTVKIDGKPTLYRVHVGPFTRLTSLDDASARLKANRIESLRLRVNQ